MDPRPDDLFRWHHPDVGVLVRSVTRPAWLTLGRATVVVALFAAGLGAIALLDRDSGRSDSPTADVGPLPSSPSPQADRRFVTIGTTSGKQFADAELQTIPASYSVVVLAKFHAGWDIALHHEAVRRLKERNPHIKVFAYMSTKYWFDANRWGDDQIDPDWFLRDDHGDIVRVTAASYDPESKELGTYVDVANPDYRDWLLSVARSWMAAAPYDGIRFDAADPIGDHGDRDVAKWQDLLSPERIVAYNDGIETLLTDVRAGVAPARVLFNGISPSPIRGPRRDLDMLDFTDGAMDEAFCLSGEGEVQDIEADIEIMQAHPDKQLQLRVPSPPASLDEAERRRLERLCVGSFLLGWQPGSTFFNMGSGYGTEQLSQQPPDIDLALGAPVEAMRHDGDALSRRFEDGAVYVNLGSQPVKIDLPMSMVQTDGVRPGATVDGTVTVPAQDAVLFLYAPTHLATRSEPSGA